MAYRKDWVQPQVGPMGFANTQKTIGRVVTMTATDLVTANTVGAFKVPAGFTVTGIIAVSTDMDTGTNAMTLSVGDATLGTRYLSGAALGQSAAQTVTTLAATGLLFLNTVDTEILITVTLGPTVAAAGTLSLYLVGFMAQ
jgi:hypothetical protein